MEKSQPHIDLRETRESPAMGKKKILVVDDNADLLTLSKTILEMENYEVFTALSGTEALAVLAKIEQLDLILLDMRMEDMSGPEFLLLLEDRRPEVFESVPVVFLSAMDKVPASKAVGFIRKPIDIAKFLAAVQRFIQMGPGCSHLNH